MTFYLLVKTHNITGLKYLCKTGVKEFYKNNPQVREDHRKAALKNNPMNKPGVRQKHKEAMESNIGKKNKSCDLRLHRFKHQSGLIENCTQNDLKRKYNLQKAGISQLVNGHKQNAYGWTLI